MIYISDHALKKIVLLKQAERLDEHTFVRVSVVGGPCSGLTYKLDFDTEIQADDEQFEDKGMIIVTDKNSLPYLENVTLDYAAGPSAKGFYFICPDFEDKSCNCGETRADKAFKK